MSLWKKLFSGGSKPTPVAPVISPQCASPTTATSCQHNWNGCKCSKCGEIRLEDGEYKGLIRNDWHDWSDDECTKCGRKRRRMTTEYR